MRKLKSGAIIVESSDKTSDGVLSEYVKEKNLINELRQLRKDVHDIKETIAVLTKQVEQHVNSIKN